MENKLKATAVHPEYRTQKAAGLKALSDNHFNTPPFDVYGVEHFNFESPYDVAIPEDDALLGMKARLAEMESFYNSLNNASAASNEYYTQIYLAAPIAKLKNEIAARESWANPKMQLGLFQERGNLSRFVNKFVRPCPMVPRHGFVDSRPVNSIEEAEKLFEETLKAEDRAEFIVMPFIKAKYSGIWTTGKLVIGEGNDGATAGHSSRVIPTLGIPTPNQSNWEKALQKAWITDSPYIELLWDKKYDYTDDLTNYFVQLRNGPELPDSIDFIPEETIITEVVLAEGDLLEWETKAKNFKKGTCVYHPGGSLASHYSIHAVLANIPVLISKAPKVGDILKRNVELNIPNIELMKAGFVYGATAKMSFFAAALTMLSGCHNTSVWLGRQDFLLGIAMGCAYRLTLTAVIGEYRHEPGRKRKPKRDAIYGHVWDKILTAGTRTRYVKALFSFNNDDRWPGSFGGPAWAKFGNFAGAMFNSLLDGDVKSALENLNKCVNAVHNSGWGFNKFVSQEYLNNAAVSPSSVLLHIAPECYKAILYSEKNARTDWFNGKHHIELERIIVTTEEEKEAARDENKEELSGTDNNSLYKPELDKVLVKLAPNQFTAAKKVLVVETHSKGETPTTDYFSISSVEDADLIAKILEKNEKVQSYWAGKYVAATKISGKWYVGSNKFFEGPYFKVNINKLTAELFNKDKPFVIS